MSTDFNINDDRLATFCQGPDFKSYVRQAINDELFWREWMNRVNLSREIDNRIESQMSLHYSSKFPSIVKKELENQIPQHQKITIDEIGRQKIMELSSNANESLSVQKANFEDQLRQMKQKVDGDLIKLSKSLTSVDKLTKRIDQLEKNIACVEECHVRENERLNMNLSVLSVISVSVFVFMFISQGKY